MREISRRKEVNGLEFDNFFVKMSDEQQYAELKKVLRAALISNNRNGVSVHELERMYREQEGRKIPLLGHGTTLGLLNSMADTVYTVRTTHIKKCDFFFCYCQTNRKKLFISTIIEMGRKTDAGFSSRYRKYTAHFGSGGRAKYTKTTVNLINQYSNLID